VVISKKGGTKYEYTCYEDNQEEAYESEDS
jgi:hypothetical protein